MIDDVSDPRAYRRWQGNHEDLVQTALLLMRSFGLHTARTDLEMLVARGLVGERGSDGRYGYGQLLRLVVGRILREAGMQEAEIEQLFGASSTAALEEMLIDAPTEAAPAGPAKSTGPRMTPNAKPKVAAQPKMQITAKGGGSAKRGATPKATVKTDSKPQPDRKAASRRTAPPLRRSPAPDADVSIEIQFDRAASATKPSLRATPPDPTPPPRPLPRSAPKAAAKATPHLTRPATLAPALPPADAPVDAPVDTPAPPPAPDSHMAAQDHARAQDHERALAEHARLDQAVAKLREEKNQLIKELEGLDQSLDEAKATLEDLRGRGARLADRHAEAEAELDHLRHATEAARKGRDGAVAARSALEAEAATLTRAMAEGRAELAALHDQVTLARDTAAALASAQAELASLQAEIADCDAEAESLRYEMRVHKEQRARIARFMARAAEINERLQQHDPDLDHDAGQTDAPGTDPAYQPPQTGQSSTNKRAGR